MTEAFFFLNPINSLPDYQAEWIPRLSDVNVLGDREFALGNLKPVHDQIIMEKFPRVRTRHYAEQIHGNSIAVVTGPSESQAVNHQSVDGLMTNLPGELLAIYAADCAAIYLVDPVKKAIALLHSGRKGTEMNILGNAVSQMCEIYGSSPSDLICILSPCIRPPDYEVNFAATIREQANDCGIEQFHDSCENTASDLHRHYSYRLEKGKTGRMLALLSIK
ncbi:polyphenol oxidase family protein [Luteolibacter sp. AS25]|uniref:polyphenol oxidase family protein n=1 Tax=Luteolibacter sp. AS25 TaxID=3135776 RepID=UPI00398A6005